MYSASIVNRGDSRAFATTTHGEFIMDTGGRGSNPIETLLAALGGCLNHQLCDFLQNEGIASRGFAVRLETELTEDKSRVGGIRVTVDMRDTAVPGEKEKGLMAAVERCKIFRTLSANSKIAVTLAR